MTDLPERRFWCFAFVNPILEEIGMPPQKKKMLQATDQKSAFGDVFFGIIFGGFLQQLQTHKAIQNIPSTHIFCQVSGPCDFWSCAFVFVVPWQQKTGGVAIKKQYRPTQLKYPNMNHALIVGGLGQEPAVHPQNYKNDLNIPQLLGIHLDVRCHKKPT